jgi:hypothetical protein
MVRIDAGKILRSPSLRSGSLRTTSGEAQGRRQLRRGFELSIDATSLKAALLSLFDMNAAS